MPSPTLAEGVALGLTWAEGKGVIRRSDTPCTVLDNCRVSGSAQPTTPFPTGVVRVHAEAASLLAPDPRLN